MINAGLFNQLVNAFSLGTDVAFANLALYSLGLLGAFGLLHFYISMSLGLTGYIPLGEALARFLWTLVKIGIFYWIITNLYDLLWGGLFLTFAKWGADAGGGFGLTDFLNPSAIVTQGFKAAYPVKVWVDQFIGPLLPLYGIDVGLGLFAYVLTVFSFVCIALHVLMTLIEFKLALATSAVLLPWAVFTHTAFVGELAISWLVAGLVRILVTGIITGIATTLFDVLTVPVPTLAGPDPTVFQALSLAAGAFVFAVLAWVVPNHAASIGGRGMALALTGEHLVSGGMAGISGVRYLSQIGGGAIRGVSKLAA